MAGEINYALLDPNAPERVGASVEQGRRNALAMQQSEQEQQMNSLRVQQAKGEMESQNALNKAYQESGGDIKKAISNLQAQGQFKPAMELQGQLTAQDKAALDLQKTKLEMGLKHFDYISQAMSGVKDQASYDVAKQHIAQTLGPQALAGIPDQYNPELIKQKQMQALPMKEQLAEQHRMISDQLEQSKFGYQQQHDIAQLSQAERHFQAGQGIRQQELALKKQEVQDKAKELGVKLSESQAKATTFASQMNNASGELDRLESAGFDPTSKRSQLDVSLAGGAGNIVASEDAQQYKQAQNQWSESFLRVKTGAAATKDEIALNNKTFFPQLGDSKKVIAQKARARAEAEKDVLNIAGPGKSLVTPRGEAGATQEPDLDALLKMYGGK